MPSVSLPTLTAVASIAGTAMSVYGSMQQGKAAKQSAQYSARIAENNAEIARRNATFASHEGAANAERKSMETRANVGAIKSAQAASGVDVGGGSAVDVRSSAAELGQLSAITIRSNAARRAYGYQTDAASSTAQAELDRAQGKNAEKSGYIDAAGTLLSQTSSGYKSGAYDAFLRSKSLSGSSGGIDYYNEGI